MTIPSSDVSDDDALELRLVKDGSAIDTYTETPSITVASSPTGGTNDRLRVQAF